MHASYHPDGAHPDDFDRELFKATLLPYRSLSHRGFQIMILCLLLLWSCLSMVFIHIGAWPVIGTFGLDIVLIYFAFRLNYHAARQCEEITVSREQLLVKQISATGQIRTYQFNPFRTRFYITRKDAIGITQMQLRSDQRILNIGKFLPFEDRENFATAFNNALLRSRR